MSDTDVPFFPRELPSTWHQALMDARPKKQTSVFGRRIKTSRAINELPLPADAVGYPLPIFEGLLSEEALQELERLARKPGQPQ